MGKSIRLSIVALHSVDGVHQQFKEVVKLADEPGVLREKPWRVRAHYGAVELVGSWQIGRWNLKLESLKCKFGHECS